MVIVSYPKINPPSVQRVPKCWILAATFAGLFWGNASVAADEAVTNEAAPGAAQYWTPERLRNAKPIDLPRATNLLGTEVLKVAPADEESLSEPGQVPTVKVRPKKRKLFEPLTDAMEAGALAANQPASEISSEAVFKSVGGYGAYFTSSRVSPAPAVQNSFPYAPAGKLYFTTASNQNLVCSASVIKARLIVTAGHCVYDAVTRQWNKNFQFIPAVP